MSFIVIMSNCLCLILNKYCIRIVEVRKTALKKNMICCNANRWFLMSSLDVIHGGHNKLQSYVN